MTGARILLKQNEDVELKRLAAQRQLYSEEKYLIGIQFWLAFGGSLGILTWKSIDPSSATQAAAVGILISLVDCLVLQHLRGKCRKNAAKIQEQFDCSVLDLSWNQELIGDELPPEGAEFRQRFHQSGVCVCRGGQRCRSDRSHDAGPCFQDAFFGAENQFSPDSLKEGFNCRDLEGDGDQAVFIHGERMENASAAVALWGPRRYISGSKFP